MGKFDVRFCSCGRIHFIPFDEVCAAVEQDKELWLICGGCGTTTQIGADIERDYNDPEQVSYNMYSGTYSEDKTFEITPDIFTGGKDHKSIYKIIRSAGYRPLMKTGMRACSFCHFGDFFEDIWYPDFYKIERKDVTVEEILEFIEKYRKDRVTVNMGTLLRELTEEELKCLSGYVIKGLDWTGTKYERKNS